MKECAKYALQAYETHLTFKRLASRSYGMLACSVMLYFFYLIDSVRVQTVHNFKTIVSCPVFCTPQYITKFLNSICDERANDTCCHNRYIGNYHV